MGFDTSAAFESVYDVLLLLHFRCIFLQNIWMI